MSNTATHAHPPAAPMHYIVIWAALVVLLAVSVMFSVVSSFATGVVFAFFIAVVKALMVAAWFMHLNIEKRWVWVILATGLLVVFVMWLGVAPDVMEPRGTNWSKALPGNGGSH